MNYFCEIKKLGGPGNIQKISNATADLEQDVHYVFISAATTTSGLTLRALGPNDIRKVEVCSLDATAAAAVNYNSTALYSFTAGASSAGTVATVLWTGSTWIKLKYEN